MVVSVNAPGANDPSKPVELTDMTYSVQDWNEQTILVGGEDDRPVYLTLNENEIEMHNMADDNTTLRFASSSEVHAEVVKRLLLRQVRSATFCRCSDSQANHHKPPSLM